MTDQHPITPPPELVAQWALGRRYSWNYIATQAARWGADMELEECVKWLSHESPFSERLRAARRPKPQSLAEEAQKEVGAFEGMGTCDLGIIRRALERLQELEGQQ